MMHDDAMSDDTLAAKYPDLLPFSRTVPRDPELVALIYELERTHAGDVPPPELEERITSALHQRAAHARSPAMTVGLVPVRRTTELGYLSPLVIPRGAATMTPKRLSTVAAGAAAIIVVALIAVLLYSMHGSGSSGTTSFQQRLSQLGGTQLVLGTAASTRGAPPISADIPIIKQRLATRINPGDTLVTTDGSNHLVVDIAGRPVNEQQALALLGTTGEINIIDTGSTGLDVGQDVTGQTCTTTCRPGQYQIVFTGAELNPNSISAGLDPSTNAPIVQFEFQGNAESAFATYTQNNIGNYLTITLDNKVIESATIQSQITGVGEISGGNMTSADAQNLAALLKYGTLPVPLIVIKYTSFLPGTPAPATLCTTPTATPAPPSAATPTATVASTPIAAVTPIGEGGDCSTPSPTTTQPPAASSPTWTSNATELTPTATVSTLEPTPTPVP